jgi:acetolactate synthase I/II/III large subunit
MSKNVATAIAEGLSAAGVERLYGLPGGEMLALLESCRKAGIEFILTHHEASAAFMAAAEGQFQRKLSACASTLGPGATNLTTGIAHAYLDRCPMIVITAGTSTNFRDDHTHQRLDIARIFAPITKGSFIITASGAPSIVDKAIRLASSEPFGPVSLNIPSDVAEQEIIPQKMQTKTRSHELVGNLSLEQVAIKLSSASKPLVLVGIAIPPDAVEQVRRFVDTFGAPVGVMPKVKGLIDEAHPLYAGTYGGMMAESVVSNFVGTRDLILCVGLDPAEVSIDWPNQENFLWMLPSLNVNQSTLPPNVWVGSIAEGLMTLTSMLYGHNADGQLDAAEVRTRITAQLENAIPDQLIGISPLRALKILAKVWSPLNPVCSDVGAHKLLMGQFWPSSYPNRFFMSNGLSSMGFGISAPIAISLAGNHIPVLSVIGDGGFLMYLGELETAKRVAAHVLYVVFRDCSLALIEKSQRKRGYPRIGVQFETPDIVKLADSFNIPAWKAFDESELSSLVKKFEDLDGPAIVDVPVDSREYYKQFG